MTKRVERNSADGYHPADQDVAMVTRSRGINSYTNKVNMKFSESLFHFYHMRFSQMLSKLVIWPLHEDI